ncbi:FKBP-type peptidyl-prolyl cis-trans isomerase N-terminal domain-containing protein [Serratia sp. root2]|uniref:FKBP-type peptidyl-prolyl cis-trans isomerase N-terminal domain-containing protein n=1 Tax=Serratia sp. root2 TaxID=3059676 RepID=UPI0028910DDA|nr:FKBP-type peptidyl-prolyl cis-trans isomerase N-terminal domain-containing protein [Serratia sp. root2]MDT3253482.1 FKBP-type peptidyl-prolyl cis-trans isomerase N-terminal domain-containing protein [Serratia sp. root2]
MKKYAEGAAAFLLLVVAGSVSAVGKTSADDGIPALLKFAEQQQVVAPAPSVAEKAPSASPPVAAKPKPVIEPRGDAARLSALNQTLRQQAEVIQQQADTVRRLERLLAVQATVPPPTEPAAVDIRPLAAALKGIRRAIAPPPDLLAMAASLARQQRIAGEQKQRLQQLSRQLAQMQLPPTLVSDADKQAYAAGVSLGRDIVQLQEQNRQLGIEADRVRLLAGIADTLNGKPRLDNAAIDGALQAADRALQQAHRQRQQTLQQDGKAYLADFAVRPGVQQDALGFYYRVDYAGSGKIAAGDNVSIVVRESLPDGTVIKDMELAGTTISLPLAQYPPLFRAAIGKLDKHGSITLAVPPELAYGDKGSPPAIPPGATMIYTLRVADVLPPDKDRQK